MIELSPWCILVEMGCNNDQVRINGRVWGHPDFRDGEYMWPSTFKSIDRKTRIATTFSGKQYHLGEFLPNGHARTEEEAFNWIKENYNQIMANRKRLMETSSHPLLDEIADFTWSFGQEWFLETRQGNYVWSDPDYGGDNTLKPFKGTYGRWCQVFEIHCGRSKGKHIIRDYCGPKVKIVP